MSVHTTRRLFAFTCVLAIAATVLAGGFAFSPKHDRHVQATYQGKTVLWWARHAVAARRDANKRLATIRAQRGGFVRQVEQPYEHAAEVAAVAYGVDAGTLIRKGRCESVNWTQFTNKSSSARGPWQFLTTGMVRRYGDGVRVNGGTWATTPYWPFSPFDPMAAAMAAAYMHAHNRGSEWSCK